MIVEEKDFNLDDIKDPRHREFIESVIKAQPSEVLGTELVGWMFDGKLSRPKLKLAQTAADGAAHVDPGDAYYGSLRMEFKHLVGTVFSPGGWPYPDFFMWAPHKWAGYKVKPYALITISADLRAFAIVWTQPTRRHWYSVDKWINKTGRKAWERRLCCPLEMVQFYPIRDEMRDAYLDIIPPNLR